jgi:hypothetical protein
MESEAGLKEGPRRLPVMGVVLEELQIQYILVQVENPKG